MVLIVSKTLNNIIVKTLLIFTTQFKRTFQDVKFFHDIRIVLYFSNTSRSRTISHLVRNTIVEFRNLKLNLHVLELRNSKFT